MTVCFGYGTSLTDFSLAHQLDSARRGRVFGWVFLHITEDLVQNPHVTLLHCLDA